jgi:flagellar motility protein MotE (MotC chaperone)
LMKTRWILRLMAIPALTGGMLFAAGPATPSTPSGEASAVQQRWWQQRGERTAAFFNMTESQKQAAKTALAEARESSKASRDQLKALHHEMFQAIKANDTAKIQSLSAKEGMLIGQVMVPGNNALAKIYSSMTPAQRAKADQNPMRFRELMGLGAQHHGAHPST